MKRDSATETSPFLPTTRREIDALGWDRPDEEGGAGMDLDRDLFAHYTVLKKKGSGISHQP